VDLESFKERQAAAWGLGEYSSLSRILAPAARELCDACAVSAGQEVLDVAAGDGNFALACAYEGASVVASDLSPEMIRRGRERAAADGYEVEWVEADAEDLPFEDGRFECAGSVFGAIFAPRPEVAARELFRVVRPGNTVGLAAWAPGSFPIQLFEVSRRYVPPPPELPDAVEWGDEDTVRARLEGLAGTLDIERRSLDWEFESAEALVEMLERDAPMQVAARSVLSEEQLEAMHGDYLDLVRRLSGGEGPVAIAAEYVLIVARKRG
jgi:SAM-dependent methyltransferase